MATAKKTAKPSKRESSFRYLPVAGVTLIDSSVFDTLQPKTKTEVITEAEGTIEFLPNFLQLKNPRYLREALLGGTDVSRALEFNGIELTDEERNAMRQIVPVLEKIGAITPPYPWLRPDEALPNRIKVAKTIVRKGDYSMTKAKLKKWWKLCSAYWAGQVDEAPRMSRHSTGSGYYRNHHNVTVTRDEIRVGCQSITRRELEALARHLEWEPAGE